MRDRTFDILRTAQTVRAAPAHAAGWRPRTFTKQTRHGRQDRGRSARGAWLTPSHSPRDRPARGGTAGGGRCVACRCGADYEDREQEKPRVHTVGLNTDEDGPATPRLHVEEREFVLAV